jgi:hypothetical protein
MSIHALLACFSFYSAVYLIYRFFAIQPEPLYLVFAVILFIPYLREYLTKDLWGTCSWNEFGLLYYFAGFNVYRDRRSRNRRAALALQLLNGVRNRILHTALHFFIESQHYGFPRNRLLCYFA